MSRIFDIADKYVDEIAALEPALATSLGVPGHEREMPDLSPDGPARVAKLNRRTVSEINGAQLEGEPDRLAREVMLERIGVSLDLYDAKEYLRALRNIASPLQGVRQVFDLMPKESEEEWSNIAARLKLVPETLVGYRQTLSEGLSRGLHASARQAREGAEQARVWRGAAAEEGKPSFFTQLREQFEKARRERGFNEALSADIESGAKAAMNGYAEMHRYLVEEYLPKTTEGEAAGRDRYQLLSRVFLGARIDLEETYQWGWEELYQKKRLPASDIDGGAAMDLIARELTTETSRNHLSSR